jgi:hypothetical protein
MKRYLPIPALLAMLALTGCASGRKPAARQTPAAPLSIPQTNVTLPAAQPLSPEAVATTVPAEAPAPVPAPRPVRRPAAPAAAAPAPVQEAMAPAEAQKLREEAAVRRHSATFLAERAAARNLNANQRALLERVRAFVRQSEDAERRNNLRQAGELAGRALILAKELEP